MPSSKLRLQQSCDLLSGKRYRKTPVSLCEFVVVLCVDPRFIKATEKFVTELNGLIDWGRFTKLVQPGGIHDFLREQPVCNGHITLMVEHFEQVKRMVIIIHEDCLVYKKQHKHPAQQFNQDTKNAAAKLFKKYPKLEEIVVAKAILDGDEHIRFETRPYGRPKAVAK